MKTALKIAALIALISFSRVTVVSAQATEGDVASVRAQIEANDHAVGRAIGMHDFGTLEKLWAPEMLVNSPGNVILTRAQVFQSIRDDKLAYSSAKTATDAFFFSGDVAVEMGHENIVMSNGPWRANRLSAATPTFGRSTEVRGCRSRAKLLTLASTAALFTAIPILP